MVLDAYKTTHKYNTKLNNNFRDFGAIQLAKAMEADLGPDGLFDHEKFNDPVYGKKVAEKVGQAMGTFTKQFAGSNLNPNNAEDAMKLQSLSYGLFGFNTKDSTDYFNQAGDQTSVAGFGSHLQQRTAMGHMASKRSENAATHLTKDDKAAVIAETGIGPKIYADRLTSVDDLSEIMGTYMANDGSVPNSFLRGKHYAKDNLEGRISTDTRALAGHDLRA